MKTLQYDEKELLRQYNAAFSSSSYKEMVRLEKIFDFIDEQKKQQKKKKQIKK